MNPSAPNPIFDNVSWIYSKNKALNDIVSRSASLIYFKDLLGKYIFINRTFVERFQKTKDFIIGKTDFDLLDNKSAKKCIKDDQKIIKSGKSISYVEKLGIDNKECYFETYKSPLRDEDNNIIGIYGISTEKTEVKNLAFELNDSNQKYYSFFNNNRDAILVTNTNREIIDANPAFEKLFGYSLKEITEKLTSYIYKDENEYKVMGERLIRNMDKSGFFNTIQYKRKDGSIFYGETNAFYLKNIDNKIIGFVGIIRDISKKILLEKEKSDLEKLIHNKDLFTSIIAHDLKNPIGVQMNLLNLVHDKFERLNSDRMKDLLYSLKHNARETFVLLEDLLSWARIQTDSLKIKPERISLKQILENCIDIFIDSAKNKHISIHVKHSSNLNAWADRNMIQSVLRNIISNSIKFTEKGGDIFIQTNNEPSDSVNILITDTGVGIKKEDVLKIMSDENNFTTPGTENEKGTGVGLILCKQFIDINKGKLKIDSDQERGTTFIITLPKFVED